MGSQKYRFFLIFLILSLLTIGLDRAFFQGLVFRIPHRGSWDEFRWFTFEYQYQKLVREGSCSSPHRPCILVVGSSIAKYSIQKEILEKKIREMYGKSVRVELLVHASMHPVDMQYYMKGIKKINPDLILFITNPADLDLARYTPPWEVGPPVSRKSNFDYLKQRVPPDVFYPGRFVWNNWRELDLEEISGKILRGGFYFLSLKGEWLDPVLLAFRTKTGTLKSYLNYQGVDLPDRLWKEGNTGNCVRIPVHALKDGNLLFQVLESQFVFPDFHIDVFTASPPSDQLDDCLTRPGMEFLQGIKPQKLGWQKVRIKETSSPWIFLRMSHTEKVRGTSSPVSPSNPIYAGRGIRLPGDFGREEAVRDLYYQRFPSLEDRRLDELSESRYIQDYEERIQPDDWRSPAKNFLGQLNDNRLGKYMTLWYEFSPEIPQARAIQNWIGAEAVKARIPVLIINNPENPIALEEYGDTRWYEGYLDFYNQLSQENGNLVTFIDLHQTGHMGDFMDPHHLTYNGLVRMAPVYARSIVETMENSGIPGKDSLVETK